MNLVKRIAYELAEFVQSELEYYKQESHTPWFLAEARQKLLHAETFMDLVEAYNKFDTSEGEASYWSDNHTWFSWFLESPTFKNLVWPKMEVSEHNYLDKGKHYQDAKRIIDELGALDDTDIDVINL